MAITKLQPFNLDTTANYTFANANLGNAATANFFIGSGNNLSNVQGANVTGSVSIATTSGTVTTAAQPNITSTGSLTGLTISNATGIVNFTTSANVTLGAVANLHISGGTANYVLQTDGAGNLTWAAQSGGSTSNISNGTSNVSIATSGGNVTTSVGGSANIMIATSSGINVAVVTAATSNTTGALQVVGGGSVYGNLYVAGLVPGAAPSTLDYLVVAGGGGSTGQYYGGGGGAGGLRSTVTATGGGGTLETPINIAVDTVYTITVGNGGTAGGSGVGGQGGNSSITGTSVSVVSVGGGGGQYGASGPTAGQGGSGGGNGSGTSYNILGTANQGYEGGDGGSGGEGAGSGGGGGGGAGAPGSNGVNNGYPNGQGGPGGNGLAVSIVGTISSTSSVAIGTGTKVFTVDSGLPYIAGTSVRVYYSAGNIMYGNITSYVSTTLTINVLTIVGSGTYAVWSIDNTYAGGGAGAGYAGGSSSITYPGGFGGGGVGGAGGTAATAGQTSTGGGGGADDGHSYFSGRTGGSGIVVIRYPSTYGVASATTGSPSVSLINNYRVYIWTTSGSITFSAGSPTPSTSTTTGTVVVEGGVGIAGNVYAGGNVTATNLIGAYANGNSNVRIATANGNVTVAAVGNTTMTITGTGVNVSGTMNASGNIAAAYFIGNASQLTGMPGGTSISNGNSNVNIPTANGNINFTAVGNANIMIVTGTGLSLSPNTVATAMSTGALQVAGGGSVSGNLYVGGIITGTTAAPATVEYLVVAGGGGGGTIAGGGGGGLLTGSNFTVSNAAPYTVTVGAGGAGAPAAYTQGVTGSNSSITGTNFASIISQGGGGGGGYYGSMNGLNGGSGGGAGSTYNAATPGSPGLGVSGQGFNGGSASGNGAGAGGGGAGGIGNNQVSATGGAGGPGALNAITGTAYYWAGGGGGGGAPPGAGGAGGGQGGITSGAAGAMGSGFNAATIYGAGQNTGGGGGGNYPWAAGPAGLVLTGGSGIVVIRYSDAYAAPSAVTGSPTVTVAGGYRVYTWTGSGSVSWVGLIPGTITPTPSTSTTTGSLVVEGGVGIAGNIYAGGNVTAANLIGPLANGNSNVKIATANGNITFSAIGNANIMTITGTGVNVAGTMNASGNIAGAFFIGNGSQLTGISGGGGASISNGNSNVNIPTANGNINFTAVGNANILIVTGTGVNVAGTLNTTGNLTAGNVSATTFTGALTGAATTAGTVTTAAQPNITSVGSLTGLTISNATGIVNFTTSANVTLGAVGNLHISGGTANYVLQTDGAGTLTWAAQSGGGGSTSNISNGTSNVSIATSGGNVTTSVAGNANIIIVTGTGVNVAGTLNTTGDLTAGNLFTSGSGGNLIGANVISANTFIAGSTSGNATGSLASVNTFGFKNRLINGGMVIDQRNAGASVTQSSVGYSLDRWQSVMSVGSKFSVQQNAGSVTPPAGYNYYLGVTSLSAYTVAATDYFDITQNIEGFNWADLGFGTASASTVTLSFWVRSSLTGTFSGTLVNSNDTQVYPFSYTISSANTWEFETITIPGSTTATWNTTNGVGAKIQFCLGLGTNFLGTLTNTWNAGTLYGPTGQVNLVSTNGATFYVTGVQLEKGNQATPFDYRDIGRELLLCYRYYFKSLATSGTSLSAGGYAYSGTNAAQSYFALPATMRAAPTSSYGGNLSLQQLAGNWLVTAIAATQSSTTAGSLSFQIGSSSMTTGQYAMVYSSSGNAYVDFSSEL